MGELVPRECFLLSNSKSENLDSFLEYEGFYLFQMRGVFWGVFCIYYYNSRNVHYSCECSIPLWMFGYPICPFGVSFKQRVGKEVVLHGMLTGTWAMFLLRWCQWEFWHRYPWHRIRTTWRTHLPPEHPLGPSGYMFHDQFSAAAGQRVFLDPCPPHHLLLEAWKCSYKNRPLSKLWKYLFWRKTFFPLNKMYPNCFMHPSLWCWFTEAKVASDWETCKKKKQVCWIENNYVVEEHIDI